MLVPIHTSVGMRASQLQLLADRLVKFLAVNSLGNLRWKNTRDCHNLEPRDATTRFTKGKPRCLAAQRRKLAAGGFGAALPCPSIQ